MGKVEIVTNKDADKLKLANVASSCLTTQAQAMRWWAFLFTALSANRMSLNRHGRLAQYATLECNLEWKLFGSIVSFVYTVCVARIFSTHTRRRAYDCERAKMSSAQLIANMRDVFIADPQAVCVREAIRCARPSSVELGSTCEPLICLWFAHNNHNEVFQRANKWGFHAQPLLVLHSYTSIRWHRGTSRS